MGYSGSLLDAHDVFHFFEEIHVLGPRVTHMALQSPLGYGAPVTLGHQEWALWLDLGVSQAV